MDTCGSALNSGLLRFDGVRYIPWQPPAGQSLPSNWIYSLVAARDGRLWIGTVKGLASWKDRKLTNYAVIADNPVSALLEDQGGTVWVGTTEPTGGRLYAIQNDSVQCYGQEGSLGRSVFSLYEENAHLWASTSTGVWQWKPGPPKLYQVPDVNRDFAQGLSDDHGRLLFSVQKELRQLIGGKIFKYSLPPAGPQLEAERLLRDRDGSLWIGTRSQGLFHLHQGKTDRFTRADGLSGDIIYAFFQDREGNIWVVTDEGLDRFRDFALPTITAKQGLSTDNVSSVQAGMDGSVWLGTDKGLNRWNSGRITAFGAESGLPGNPTSLFEDHHGRIWVPTFHGTVYFETGRFIPVPSLPKGQAHTIVEDSDGEMWFAYDDSLVQLLKDGSIQRTPWAQLGHKESAIVQIPDPARGGFWLSFRLEGGVAYFKDGQIRESYTAANGLGKGNVGDLQLDLDGTLWAATEGGLSRLKAGHITTLTSRNGLPCDSVHWMREDNDDSVWMYMACGMVRIPRSELDAWAANPRRMIQTATFDTPRLRGTLISGYTPRVSKAADGKLWFLEGDGVSVVDSRHLPSPFPLPVQIEQINADHRIYWDNLTSDQSPNLRLPPLVRDLEIDYTVLSLASPETTRFRYKLEGHDPDWKDVGNERKAYYNDLPPRNYRFRVMASNNSGVWNEAGASFEFAIAPAYYQTRWFQASCVAAFLGFLWALYRYRLHQIAQQFNTQLEARVGERTRIARDLHDTLLQSFQGLLLRFKVVDESLPPGEAKEELERALDLAARAITEGRDTVQGLRSSTVETNDLARAIGALGEELAGDETNPNRVQSTLVVEGTPRDLHPILRDEVYRIAGEALRNAFRHAQARRIEVAIGYGERQFRLRVHDDGKGIDPEVLAGRARAGHWGLPGMRERAELIGGKLEVWSQRQAGTEIELSIRASIAYAASYTGLRSRLFAKSPFARKTGTNS